MSKILIPSSGPNDWKQFLAQPDLHWATGYSARTLAHAWESAPGLPPEVETQMSLAFGPSTLLFAIPEHKTSLPGGKRESQSDVFALVRHPKGLATYTIEGKVDEPFGPTVEEWLVDASPGIAASANAGSEASVKQSPHNNSNLSPARSHDPAIALHGALTYEWQTVGPIYQAARRGG